MLTIEIKAEEKWDEKTECFIPDTSCTLVLEHSLISLAKWESKWHKSYLGTKEKTLEEHLDYIGCMVISKNFNPDVLTLLTEDNINAIGDYINDPMTATVLPPPTKGGGKEVTTAEILYYDMIALNIPVEFQKWHLNRLVTLIKVCDIKSQPAKKMTREEAASRNAQINAANRAKYNSPG